MGEKKRRNGFPAKGVALSVLTTLFIVGSAQALMWRWDYLRFQITGQPAEVPITTLTAESARYDGVRVRVIGYLELEFEGNRICPSKEAFLVGDSASCLWVDDMSGARRRYPHYALVEGTFSASDHGHMGAYSGALTSVTRDDDWSVPLSVKADVSRPDYYAKGVMTQEERAACAKRGGRVQSTGDDDVCLVPFSDGGKRCTDNMQCEGACIYASGERTGSPPFFGVSGECQRQNLQLGCYGEVNNGTVGEIVCRGDR